MNVVISKKQINVLRIKAYFYLIVFFTATISLGQNLNKNDEIINLAQLYKKRHSLVDLKSEEFSFFDRYKGTNFETTAFFIRELTQENNNVFHDDFLSRPDSLTLKLFHTIIMVNYNMYDSNSIDNSSVVEKYQNSEILQYEQLKQYYGSLFTSIINKNRPFDYSQLNWDLRELSLLSKEEQATFFLTFIDKLGSQAWDYLNAIQGPNWDGIEKYITILPQINGKPYYEFSGFDFKDFKMKIYKEDRFFKKFYLPKLYEVLVSHALMMIKKGYGVEEVDHLYSNSILSNEEYYSYCDQKLTHLIFNIYDYIEKNKQD